MSSLYSLYEGIIAEGEVEEEECDKGCTDDAIGSQSMEIVANRAQSIANYQIDCLTTKLSY